MIADILAGTRRRAPAADAHGPPQGGLDAVIGLLACAAPAARRRLLDVLLRAAAEGF